MRVERFGRIPRNEYISLAFDVLQKRKENNAALATHLHNPVRLFYPAGRWDIDHITMPSVKAMAIVDLVSLLSSDSTLNTHSASIHAYLEAHNGTSLPLVDILQKSTLSRRQKKDLSRNLQQALEEHVRDIARDHGFFGAAEAEKSDAYEDSFVDVLARIALFGGDMQTLRSVQIGKFKDDFHVQFMLDGEKKTIIFRQDKIDDQFSVAGRESERWARSCFDGYEQGQTTVIVKGDRNSIAQHVIESVRPDTILGKDGSMDKVILRFSEHYDFPERSFTVPYPNQEWGYEQNGNISGIKIGYRIPALV